MMVELKQTEAFRKWRMRLKDGRARAHVLTALLLDTLGMWSRSVRESANCAFTMAPVTGFTFKGEEARSSSCYAVEIKVRRQKILRQPKGLSMNGVKKMAEKLTTYDPAEDLTSDEAIAAFMAEAFESNDVGYIAHALGVVARARGMTQIASQTGLSREQLYRSFSERGNPTLKTTLAVMKALGINLTARIHAQ